MPTRKQRRRRQKERRHEWEYVYVDDSGHEVEVEEEEGAPARSAKAGKQATKSSAKPAARGGQTTARGAARKVEPPSLQRVFRRTALFAPVMLVIIYVLKPEGANPVTIIVQLAVLLLFFIPFSYYVDGLMYRRYRKGIGDPVPPRERAPRKR